MTDFAALNARSKFWGDDGRAAFRNWEEVTDPRNPLGGRQGVDERIMLRELLRRLDMLVLLENRLDALVRLHTPLPPAKIGGANDPLGGGQQSAHAKPIYGPNAGLTEVLIPAGYVTKSRTRSSSSATTASATCRPPPTRRRRSPPRACPFSLVFRAEPGREDIVLKIASAYEAASKRRIPPPPLASCRNLLSAGIL